jgi:hypothetical protein
MMAYGVMHKVKNTWAKEIWRKGWGWRVRVRVTLRKRLHRNPTYGELKKAYQEPENNYQDITPDDIRAAYDRGEEVNALSSRTAFLY